METNSVKKKLEKARINRIVLTATLLIVAVLLLAAYGKWFHPIPFLKWWDRGISLCELVFISVLVTLRKRWWMWLGTTFVFASWGGYAFFWHQIDLPCGCMGEKLHIPTSLSLSLDASFFVIGMFFTYVLGGRKKALRWSLLLGGVGFTIGWMCAREIYTRFVL